MNTEYCTEHFLTWLHTNTPVISSDQLLLLLHVISNVQLYSDQWHTPMLVLYGLPKYSILSQLCLYVYLLFCYTGDFGKGQVWWRMIAALATQDRVSHVCIAALGALMGGRPGSMSSPVDDEWYGDLHTFKCSIFNT